MKQPIIFIGMHRSGTSMLGRLLEDLGLFSGVKQDRNNEAIFFKSINEWLMTQSGARWDMPGAIQYLIENDKLRKWIDDYLRYSLNSPRGIQFLGFKHYVKTGGILQLNIPWGWKDPRNTFTLPFWLRVFPEAKIIYIERHGVDVAQSLKVRYNKTISSSTRRYQKYRPFYSVLSKPNGFVDSPRCATLEGGFSIWKEYTTQASKFLNAIPKERALELRYEDVLQNPEESLMKAAKFCELDVTLQDIQLLTGRVNYDRAYSYLKNPELCDFAIRHKLELSSRGYN